MDTKKEIESIKTDIDRLFKQHNDSLRYMEEETSRILNNENGKYKVEVNGVLFVLGLFFIIGAGIEIGIRFVEYMFR